MWALRAIVPSRLASPPLNFLDRTRESQALCSLNAVLHISPPVSMSGPFPQSCKWPVVERWTWAGMTPLSAKVTGNRSDGKVAIRFPGYHPTLVGLAKQINGSHYHQGSWLCPQEELGTIRDLLLHNNVQVEYEGFTNALVGYFSDNLWLLAVQRFDQIMQLAINLLRFAHSMLNKL